jgi:AcrR family transcriptional regulator
MIGGVHPNNKRAGISDEALRDLYVAQGLTLQRISERLGVSPTTVRRRFADVALPARPRGPVSQYWIGGPLGVSFAWTSELAYVVGLMATDGNLSSNGRALSLTSKDVDLLELVRDLLTLRAHIVPHKGTFADAYRLQWTNRALHLWMQSIGLTPAKSLTIGQLDVPDEVFVDFFRGCIDGDGSIVTYVDRYNTSKNPKYVYERLYVSLVSASPCFLEWNRVTIRRLRGLSGHLTVTRNRNKHDIWCLRYAKRESVSLLKWMYYAPTVPSLSRKRLRAERALLNPTWYRHALSDLDTR